MKKSFTHRLLVTLALTGMFFQTLYPLMPIYKVYAEDTVVVEENSSSSSNEKLSETSSSSSESIQISSESSSSSNEAISETSSSSTVSIDTSTSSESSTSSSSSSSEESVIGSSSSSSETSIIISSSSSSTSSKKEETVVSETSTSSVSSEATQVVNPDIIISTIVPELNEVVDVKFVESNKTNNILADLFPFLFTDKSDYAPTESAVISGNGFSPNGIYRVTVSSNDNPSTSTTYNVLASSEGTFTYVYQLDGIYRPNYKVEVKDVSGVIVATTSFTDSDTTYKAPTSSSGNWTNASNAYANGGGSAEGTSSNYETYSSFGFSIPAGNIITGIEVQADTWSSDDDFCQLNVELSWNGGSNWTSQKSTGNLGNSESTKTLGTSSDNWGRTWSVNDFTNSNFRLRVQHGDSGSACGGSDSTYLDFIRAKVTYISNVAPVITEGTSTNVVMSQNGTPTAFALTLNATDADIPSQALSWSISSNGSHGSATASGTGSSKAIGYTPTLNYIGTDTFTVLVSDQYGLTDSILVNVTINSNSVSNPILTQTCGLDIALVIDNSGSISSSELTQMKNAMTGFTSALSGTPTQFSVTRFATTANVVQGFTSNITNVNSAINGIPVDGGSTNWQDGLVKTLSTLPNRTNPNLVIFASDGNPNRTGVAGTSVTELVAVSDAVLIANAIKTSGTRIIALGIGNGLDIANLQAISGPTVGTNLSADVITSDFATLATSLASFASQTCGGTITVSKYLDNLDTPAGSGWQFNVNGQNYLTDTNGQTQAIAVPVGSDYSVIENGILNGFSFGSTVCKNQNNVTLGTPTTNGVSGISIANTDIVSCKVINNTLPQTGTIIVQKAFEGTPGSYTDSCFTLTPDAGKGTVCATNPNGLATFNNVPFNTYSINEISTTTGYSQVGNTCTDKLLDLNNLVQNCTITNKRDTGKITIDKTVIPSTDTTGFTFNRSGSDLETVVWGMAGNTPPVSHTLQTGTYSFTESPITNWVNTSIVCSNGWTSLVNFVINKGDDITCTFTNVLTPEITIALDTTHEVGDDHTFIVTVGYNGSGGFVPVADGTIVNSNITPSGAVVNDSDCTNGTTSGTCNIVVNSTTPGTFVVNASSSVVVDGYTFNISTIAAPASVTFVDGRIVLSPLTATNNVNEAHTFTVSVYQNPGNGEVVSPNTLVTFSLLNNTAGATFVSGNTCTTDISGICNVQINTSTPGNVDVNAATNISVNTVNLTRTTDGTHGSSVNGSKSYVGGRIIIVKETLPDLDSTKFEFSSNYTANFQLADGESKDSGFLPLGIYSVSELDESGWVNTSATCDDQSPINAINLTSEEVVTCTFTNTKLATLTVQKTTNPSNDPTLFVINLTGEFERVTPNIMKLPDTVSDSTDKVYTLGTGTYSVTEDIPEGWGQDSNTCTDIVLEPGDSKTCLITNTKFSSITIVKNASVNGLDDFIFNGTFGTFTLDDDEGVVGADDTYSNSKSFIMLSPLEYTFTEVNPTELWGLRDVVCKDSKGIVYTNVVTLVNGVKVNLNAGVDLTCTFNNVKGEVLGEQTGEVLAVTGDNSLYLQFIGLSLILGSFGVLVIRKTRKKYSK